jgi:hypothetical protein
MPSRHLPRKKSSRRKSSTSSPRTKTKPNKKRVGQKQRERKSIGAEQSIRASLRLQRGERVVKDMLRDPLLSFTAAARKRKVDPRWVLKHLGSKFEKDSSGRIRVEVHNARHKTLYKPTDTPGVSIPVITKNKRERQLLGNWMAAVDAAGRGDWSKMRRFPKRKRIGGILLETDSEEVQAILRALAEEESPFEGLYRAIVRPS